MTQNPATDQDAPRGADWTTHGDPSGIAETLAMLDAPEEDGVHPRDLFEAAVEAEGTLYPHGDMRCAALHGVVACALTPSALPAAWCSAALKILTAVLGEEERAA